MTGDDTKPRMPVTQRHVYGPRPVSALIPGLTRPAYRRRAPATAQVLADWETIVGPTLSRVTIPKRLHGGTLAIACPGPVAVELQHQAAGLLERINAHVGRAVVERLRFVQAVAPQTVEALPSSSSQAAEAAEDRAVASLPQGELRDALASLGRAVLAARPKPATPSGRKR
jgi:hypothetical protein